jgi:hypothetical protein
VAAGVVFAAGTVPGEGVVAFEVGIAGAADVELVATAGVAAWEGLISAGTAA